MAKYRYQVVIALSACTLLVLTNAYRRSPIREFTQTLAQSESSNLSICYMRLDDGRQMDLREICGKAVRDRSVSSPTTPTTLTPTTSSAPLNDDDDESSVGQTPSTLQPAVGAKPVPTPTAATPPLPRPTFPSAPGVGQPIPTTIVPSSQDGITSAPSIAQPGTQPTPRLVPQVVPVPERRED